jgi:DNA (cytosine-5)-methyltransferase 1
MTQPDDGFPSVAADATQTEELAGSSPLTSRRSGAKRGRLLDLFCCAGGAARGYADAGFEVIGVDIKPQPNYPYEFHQADALNFPLDGFDAVHASPPCQSFTAYRRKGHGVGDGYLNLILQTRERLIATGLPYVIENVEQARPELIDPVRYCGSSFGLNIRRHRLFESNVALVPPPCDHGWQTPRFPPATNRTNLRCTVEIGVWRIPLSVQQEAMGMDWTTLRELSEAIPPIEVTSPTALNVGHCRWQETASSKWAG